MEENPVADQSRCSDLLAEVATGLLNAHGPRGPREMEGALDRVRNHFDGDVAFVRRHDLAGRRSHLVARLPLLMTDRNAERGPATGIDSELDLEFDHDPFLSGAEHQKSTLITHPRDPDGPDQVLVTVPLLHHRGDDDADPQTIGMLGLIRPRSQPWDDDELEVLGSLGRSFGHFLSRREAENRLAMQVHYDELTGLPNRRKLTETIDEIPDGTEASLLILDVDNMKVINDGLDFDIGSQFIAALAQKLLAIVRPTELVIRLSGDEFAILVVGVPPGQAEGLASRLVSELAETLIVEGISVARSVSIGVAHNSISDSNQELLSEADAALHQAKRRGKKRTVVFDEDMRTKVLDHYEVEIELRRALENEEFTLHYQPEVDLVTGEIRAVEALVRWNHPKRGLLTAGAFIETAEESGLVVDIGDTVLRQAIRQLSQWQHDHPDLEMWVNVSPAQLMARDVAHQIQELANEFDANPRRLCLEVTEHVVLGDLEATTGVLKRLRAMGVKLALDDFGTGYSSMKQLKDLPFNTLKIDMTFVAGLGISDHDSAIVDAAITLAGAFGLGTVAEGVETRQQIDELRRRGCRYAQGFLLARPAAAEAIEEMLGQPLDIDGLPARHS